jgi:hypothetical protein
MLPRRRSSLRGRLSVGASFLIQFGSRLGDEIGRHFPYLVQGFTVENHTVLYQLLGNRPQNAPHRLDNGRPEYYGADSYGETGREIAFEYVFNQGH